ncbi:MAG TPA: response regulator transcription factor [Roseiflexaceae bacterium]|nr:response regulator transcription factor [Roseiflexaceae bacterium]
MTIEVFLADDHAVMRAGLRLLLEAQPDLRVIGEAANGREAVRQAQIKCPDVLIMDIAMAELNGIEATRQICALCPDTRVLVLSMYSTEEYVARALHAGALGYVLKEAAGADVIDAVRAVYAGRQYFSPKIAAAHSYSRRAGISPLQSLSEREREILQLIVEGHSSAHIGGILNLSPKTVETYRSRLMHKLDLHDLPGLVKFAIQHGLTSLE